MDPTSSAREYTDAVDRCSQHDLHKSSDHSVAPHEEVDEEEEKEEDVYCSLRERRRSSGCRAKDDEDQYADVSHALDRTSATDIATEPLSNDEKEMRRPDVAQYSQPRLRRSRASGPSIKRRRTGKYSRSGKRDDAPAASSGSVGRKASRARRPSRAKTRGRAATRCRRRRRRRTRNRDPRKPKRPVSAFILFMNEFRRKHSAAYKGLSILDLTKIGGQVWNNMTLKKKCEYQQKSNRLHEIYSEEMRQYKAASRASAVKRPQTAYQIFLKKFYREHKNDKRCPTAKEALIKGARKWRRMTLREKMPFNDLSEELQFTACGGDKQQKLRETSDRNVRFDIEHLNEHVGECSDYGSRHEADELNDAQESAAADMTALTLTEEASLCSSVPLHHAISDSSLEEQARTEAEEGSAVPRLPEPAASRKSSGLMDFFSTRFRSDSVDAS